MRKMLLGMVGLVAFAVGGSANAADLRPVYKAPPVVAAPVWSWTGFYIGIEGGGGWGRTTHTDTAGTTTGGFNQSGGLVGGTLGFNWQSSNWVWGIESDLSWANITGSVATPLCVGGSCFTTLRWLDTDRVRLGVAWNQFLIYATGGVAVGNVRAGQDSCVSVFQICGTDTRVGWTAGGGIEAMIAPNWSAKVEYLFVDLGTHATYQPVIPVNVTERVSIVRAGLNWHFNWGGPVVARY